MTSAFSLPAPDALPPLPRTDVPQEIFTTALGAVEGGHEVALVTLVEVRGRAARALGAQMIVLDDGRHCGYVAGGCTEAAIATEAAKAIASGHGRMLKLGEGSPFFDIVLPCGGGMDLAIQIVDDPGVFAQALDAFYARAPFALALALDPGADAIRFGPPVHRDGWNGGVFYRSFRPRPRLLVCGRGIEAEALVRLASQSDIEVVCVTPDPHTAHAVKMEEVTLHDMAAPGNFDPRWIDADTAVALLFHDLDWERELLREMLTRPAFYIGALGSRTTHERRCAALASDGVSAAAIARIKGPIGAFGPARDSAALAASILADVFAARNQRP